MIENLIEIIVSASLFTYLEILLMCILGLFKNNFFSKNLAANGFSHYVTLKNDTNNVAQKILSFRVCSTRF